MAAISGSEKPRAMRSITVASRSPARKASIAVAIWSAVKPRSDGIAVVTAAAWQPEQPEAPGGGPAAAAGPVATAADAATQQREHTRRPRSDQAVDRSWCLSGSWRMRLPVAAKIAFSTAGAATAIVGSPTPPQKPPDGMTMVSTTGISSIRMTW